jgi:hypothetical protein
MTAIHRWNHVNYAVPPERMAEVEACLDALFPWEKFVAKPTILGYRLTPDLHDGALYVRPVPAAGALSESLARLRAVDATLDAALDDLERIDADWADHTGFAASSVAEWEERVANARRLSADHPAWRIRVVSAIRPGEPGALTDYLYQAFIRVGLLGPFRNTFEMQARR